MHFTCCAATIWLYTPASMSLAAETRLHMLFNDILKAYEAIKNVGYAPCAWAKPPGKQLKSFYAIVVNLMHFTCHAATIWLCAPASMSPAAEMRLNILFNDIWKAYDTHKNSSTHRMHGPNRLADNVSLFMRLWSIRCISHVSQPQYDSVHLPACL